MTAVQMKAKSKENRDVSSCVPDLLQEIVIDNSVEPPCEKTVDVYCRLVCVGNNRSRFNVYQRKIEQCGDVFTNILFGL